MTLIAFDGTANAVTIAFYSTEIAAARLGIRPQTMRAGVCRAGEYAGIKPVKRVNRLLGWPATEVDRVAAGLPAVAEAARCRVPSAPDDASGQV